MSVYLSSLNPEKVVLKLDFQNAFNSLRRDRLLEAVFGLAPILSHFVHSAYSSPSTLFWGDKTIQSAEGVQQGGPLCPLLLCLSIHRLCSHLRSELCLFYLDDGSLGGCREEVLHDLELVEREGAELGLRLNHEKSEVISSDNEARAAVLSSLPGALVVDPGHAVFLGSPVGNLPTISSVLRGKLRGCWRSWGRGSGTSEPMTPFSFFATLLPSRSFCIVSGPPHASSRRYCRSMTSF